MRYKFHKTSLKRGSSYIKSPEWIANKKATINPKNTKCNCCFAYSIIVALNHQNIKNHPERIVNIIPFKDQYDSEGMDFPAGIKDWKKFEKIMSQLLLIFCRCHMMKKIYLTCANLNTIISVKIR